MCCSTWDRWGSHLHRRPHSLSAKIKVRILKSKWNPRTREANWINNRLLFMFMLSFECDPRNSITDDGYSERVSQRFIKNFIPSWDRLRLNSWKKLGQKTCFPNVSWSWPRVPRRILNSSGFCPASPNPPAKLLLSQYYLSDVNFNRRKLFLFMNLAGQVELSEETSFHFSFRKLDKTHESFLVLVVLPVI